ncbi:acyl-CoA thioesterase [Paenibacillus wulumuqiensis]|uniref:acyl-CoA thioesterase n=1 Tax=Paenibacillus wulumuqiensis TaxID=1567107 RepID=UPI000619F8C5|nr:thioesterase family protein [Paenibacillus wulumuqiensis]
MAREQLRLPSEWHGISFRVRYQENDPMGVVYHTNYLNWFELGRTEMIRDLGFRYRDMEAAGVLLPLVDASLSYGRPARYDDRVAVYTRVVNFSRLRIDYEYRIHLLAEEDDHSVGDASAAGPRVTFPDGAELPGEPLTNGSTRHVWVSRDFVPVRLDKVLPPLYDSLVRALQ